MRSLQKPYRVVLTYGCFDQFDQRHVSFLRQAAQLGDELIVGCATDDYAAATGTPCLQAFAQRREVLEKCRFVARVIAKTSDQQKRTDIVNYNVSLLVMGAEDLGRFAHLQDIAQIRYLPAFRPALAAQDGTLFEQRIALG